MIIKICSQVKNTNSGHEYFLSSNYRQQVASDVRKVSTVLYSFAVKRLQRDPLLSFQP